MACTVKPAANDMRITELSYTTDERRTCGCAASWSIQSDEHQGNQSHPRERPVPRGAVGALFPTRQVRAHLLHQRREGLRHGGRAYYAAGHEAAEERGMTFGFDI